jgi:hypothetical protein
MRLARARRVGDLDTSSGSAKPEEEVYLARVDDRRPASTTEGDRRSLIIAVDWVPGCGRLVK